MGLSGAGPPRRTFLAVVAAGFMVAPVLAQERVVAENSPVLSALRLAMLAERMAKLHAQAALGILPDRSRRHLAEATREFDALLPRVQAGAASAEARENFLLLRLLWADYRPWVARPPSRDTARKLVERTEEVAWIAIKGARMLGPDAGPAVTAARAAILAQRVPRIHLLRRGAGDEARELAESEAQLRYAVAVLRDRPGNTREALAEIQLAENQLQFLEQAIREPPTGARRLEFIAKAGDHLMESMQRLARGYDVAGATAAPG